MKSTFDVNTDHDGRATRSEQAALIDPKEVQSRGVNKEMSMEVERRLWIIHVA
jgi:hypothetical protein